jgi:hypothetical protein
MDEETLLELVQEAVKDALREELGGAELPIARRMLDGRVLFEDDQGREVRAVSTLAVFKKITAVREKLRVLEQKVNNCAALDEAERAEWQALITRAYGSLTTFNFLFRDEEDRFQGTGG